MAKDNCKTIRSLGCKSVHIGGGEPLLKPDRLFRVLEIAGETGVAIDYVETNSSWYKDLQSAYTVLENLMVRGVLTLLVSMSPFHNEFIPFYKVKGVIAACREVGMGIFPWIRDFYPELDSKNDRRTHTIEEYLESFGQSYLQELPQRYWISNGGRALETFSSFRTQRPLSEIVAESGPCTELAAASHFHLDLFGNYIPGLCAGLAIDRDDLGVVLQKDNYPILTALYADGIAGLLKLAQNDYDFKPKHATYGSKCELCYEIRHYLVIQKKVETHELQPMEHYQDR